jgi:hypothetical protein
MSCVINASVSNGLTLTSDLSGVIQLQNNGVNLPMGGVAPAFSAYLNSAQTPTNSTFTKVLFDAELWDTNSNFASSRFTPTVAGYYQVNSTVNYSLNNTTCLISIYKNGTEYKRGNQETISTTGSNASNVSGSVYCNGSTDYVEIYIFQTTATALTVSAAQTYFDGCLVRGA